VNDREPKRSAREIRASIEANRERIEEDLATLGDRLQKSVNPIRKVGRHPLLLAAAGAVVGFLVIKNPALLARSVGRLARWGAPLVLTALFRSPSAREEIAAPQATPPENPPEN
jgi:hypothetical protein